MSVRLAVFGNPVEHSLSPLIHQSFAKQEGRALSYEKIRVTESFATSAQAFFNPQEALAQAVGCNITVPCKLEAFAFAHEHTKRAARAGAVNTLYAERQADGSLKFLGDNTDGGGLFLDLTRLNCPLKEAHVLILGAGGATRGIIEPLLEPSVGLQSLTITNRSVEKAELLVKSFSPAASASAVKLHACAYADLNAYQAELQSPFTVVINATSLSMQQLLPPLADSVYAQASFVYDLFYTPQGQTIFTQKAEELGAKQVYDGLGMLVSQAALSYQLWFKVLPDVTTTLNELRSYLQNR